MQANLAEVVYPFMDHAVELRDRLLAGEPVLVEMEQNMLKALLDPLAPELPGDFSMELTDPDEGEPEGLTRTAIRRALLCWIDEFLIDHTPQGRAWSAHALLPMLDGARDGARLFWDEARYAETRGDLDALETMYWCVMLGFRGELKADAERLAAWVARVRHNWEGPAPPLVMPAALEVTSLPAVPRERRGPYLGFSALLAFAVVAPWAVVVLLRAWPTF